MVLVFHNRTSGPFQWISVGTAGLSSWVGVTRFSEDTAHTYSEGKMSMWWMVASPQLLISFPDEGHEKEDKGELWTVALEPKTQPMWSWRDRVNMTYLVVGLLPVGHQCAMQPKEYPVARKEIMRGDQLEKCQGKCHHCQDQVISSGNRTTKWAFSSLMSLCHIALAEVQVWHGWPRAILGGCRCLYHDLGTAPYSMDDPMKLS